MLLLLCCVLLKKKRKRKIRVLPAASSRAAIHPIDPASTQLNFNPSSTFPFIYSLRHLLYRSTTTTATMTDSPGSPLSSIASDDISDRDDVKHVLSPSGSNKDITSSSNMPPSKRRRTGAASWDRNTPVSTTYQDDLPPAPASPSSSISSDTDGEIPNSPNTLALLGGSQEDDYSGQCNDQVTVCRWEGCDAGKLGNMDDLVHHIHNDHIGTRQKKYSCEWADCNRKGQTHASGYALRAHMRSHTREKPFYCSLPGMFFFFSFVWRLQRNATNDDRM